MIESWAGLGNEATPTVTSTCSSCWSGADVYAEEVGQSGADVYELISISLILGLGKDVSLPTVVYKIYWREPGNKATLAEYASIQECVWMCV